MNIWSMNNWPAALLNLAIVVSLGGTVLTVATA